MSLSNFPLFQVQLPNETEMPQVRYSNPLLWMETLRLRNLVVKLKGTQKRRREEWFVDLLRRQMGTRPSTISLHPLNDCIKDANDLLKDMKRWVPRRFSEIFSSEGIVAFNTNYLQLLLMWDEFQAKAQEGNELARIREFEARRTLYLAMHLLQTRAADEPSEEANDSGYMTRLLEELFFNAELQDKIILSWHDPKNLERVNLWRFKGEEKPDSTDNLILKQTYLKCRSFSWNNAKYLVYFDSRVKDDRERTRKSLQKGIPDPRIANTDDYGLRFVFFGKEDLEAGLLKLCLEVWPLPFMSWKASDNTNEDGEVKGEKRSPHSNRNFRALKFKIASSGFWPEVIIQRLENYLNHKCSKGPEVHSLYRSIQLRKTIFPILLPLEIYGIEWLSEEVADLVEQTALAGID